MTNPEDRFHELKSQAKVTGIDFIYVHPDQVTLDIYFLRSPATIRRPLTGDLHKEQIHIRSASGEKTPEIPVVSIDWQISGQKKISRFQPLALKFSSPFICNYALAPSFITSPLAFILAAIIQN